MARDTRRSFRELERELEDLEETPPPRARRETSTGGDEPTLGDLADAYADVYGPWRHSAQAPEEYQAAVDWLFGRREEAPPIPSGAAADVFADLLREWGFWELMYELAAVYDDDIDNEGGYPPLPEEREAMIDAVREAEL